MTDQPDRQPDRQSAEPSEETPATAPAPRIPAAALADRNALARRKGMPGLVITGGEDPDPEAGRREERRYLRLLLVMVAIIVLGGFILGFIGLFIGGPPPA